MILQRKSCSKICNPGVNIYSRTGSKAGSSVSIGSDFKSMLHNRPWWLLIGAALCFILFNTVRGATVAYFFADVIGFDAHIAFFSLSLLFYSGLFLSIGELAKDAIDYTVEADYRNTPRRLSGSEEMIVDCNHLAVSSLQLDGEMKVDAAPHSFTALMCLGGEGRITVDGHTRGFHRGCTFLVPACVPFVKLSGDGVFLRVAAR